MVAQHCECGNATGLFTLKWLILCYMIHFNKIVKYHNMKILGLSQKRQEKKRKMNTEQMGQQEKSKSIKLNPMLSIIILTVNGPNISIKRQKVS